ncbi:MAG: sensor histidine kinase [Chloroflexota bacterium]
MDVEPRSRFRLYRTSLRARVALGVALPILLVLTLLSVIQYWRGSQLLEDQIRLTAVQLGDVVTGSLRHAMLTNDRDMLAWTLVDMSAMENVLQVQIVAPNGEVRVDSRNEAVGMIMERGDPGCIECHQFPAGSRPRTTRYSRLADGLRISTPIANEPACARCHHQMASFLGVLLADVSVVDMETHLRHDLQVDLVISVAITLLVTLGLYFLVHRLVVRRVEAFRPSLSRLAAGDLTTRLPASPAPTDELDELAGAFNHMASELERRAHEQEERHKLREQAMAEERARIARELHDGLAQLLGYVNTKAMAVRLMLKNHRMEAANQTLIQLEEAARELYSDVREAIVDLKTGDQNDADLATMLKEAITQFSWFSNLPVEFMLAPAGENLALTAEIKLQLLRIAQESLTNIRKHASATKVWVSLRTDGDILELMVGDNGQGFDPTQVRTVGSSHFGLSAMRERAEAINAVFNLDSKPGAGTRIIIHLLLNGSVPSNVEGDLTDACPGS